MVTMMVLSEQDHIQGGKVALLKGKTVAFYVWRWCIALSVLQNLEQQLAPLWHNAQLLKSTAVFDVSGVKLDLIGGHGVLIFCVFW